MYEVKQFKNDMFNISVMIDTESGQEWFDLKEICECIGITNYRNVVARIDEEDTKLFKINELQAHVHSMDTNTKPLRDRLFVNESGLYQAIMGGRATEITKPFRRWVTHDVLPQIRKYGYYLDKKRLSTELDNVERALKDLRALRINGKNLFNKILSIIKCATDYDSDSGIKSDYFKKVQAVFHRICTGKTGSELIVDRCDHKKEHCGLGTYEKKHVGGLPTYEEAGTGRNYYTPEEHEIFCRITNIMFDICDLRLSQNKKLTMSQIYEIFIEYAPKIADKKIETGPGTVSYGNARKYSRLEIDNYIKLLPHNKFQLGFEY